MKHSLSTALLLAVSLVFSACSDTNDRGVIIDRPFSLFGANVNPAGSIPSVTPVAVAPAVTAAKTKS